MWHGLNLTVEWDIKFNAFRLHHDKTAEISLLFLSTLCHSWCGHDDSWRTHQEITARARLQKTCSEHFTSIGFIMLPLSWCYLYCLLLLLWLGHRFMYVMCNSVLISDCHCQSFLPGCLWSGSLPLGLWTQFECIYYALCLFIQHIFIIF